MGAIIVVDALWGDSGKGKIASYLASKRQARWCARAGTGTNSGHSLYLDEQQLLKTSQIPLAGILSGCGLLIGSGVAIDPELLETELCRYETYGVRQRLQIDQRCPVILPEYREAERNNAHLRDTIGSTMSGTGYAQAQFCLRAALQAKDMPLLQPYLADVPRLIHDACFKGQTVIVEGSQGTQLSLALSHDYPYCTSGNCTTAAFADAVGLNWQHISEVVLVVKAAPSRVGMGPLPGELSLQQQNVRGLAEYGVRTGRRRRKSLQMPWELVEEAVRLNGPTSIALTFCDHIDPKIAQTGRPGTDLQSLIQELEKRTGIPVSLLEYGKSYNAIVEWKQRR